MTDKQFVFYDLETSGLNAAKDRIMQFAAIKTNAKFEKVEEYNFLIQLADDILPSPGAIKVTGITPQKTVEEGYTEAQAAKIIHDQVFTENTVIVGFNNIRFDDNFIRYLFWRNYYDPYEWSYKNGRSRWDMLDVVRTVRALSPGGIKWPMSDDGKPVNKLELLSSANKLKHVSAHDALSDVEALIGVTKMLHDQKGELFWQLFALRDKQQVRELVNLDRPQPFIYVSGRLEVDFNHATLAYPLIESKNNNIIVWNLRYDPSDFVNKSPAAMAKILVKKQNQQKSKSTLELANADSSPVIYFKELKYNQCPAVLPVAKFMNEQAWQQLKLDKTAVRHHLAVLKKHPEIGQTIAKLYQIKTNQREAKNELSPTEASAEEKLYDAFIGNDDKARANQILELTKDLLADYQPNFIDQRLNDLWLGYKARSFSKLLTAEERLKWDEIRVSKIIAQVEPFLAELHDLFDPNNEQDQYLATELQLWLESIAPELN